MKLARLTIALIIVAASFSTYAGAQQPPPTPRADKPQPPERAERAENPNPVERPRVRREAEFDRPANPQPEQLRARAEAMRAEAAALQEQAERMSGDPTRPRQPGQMRDVGVFSTRIASPGDQLDRMRNWLDTVERYVRLARNPIDSAVAAVITANDILRPKGPDAAIDYFQKILPTTKNDAVQRAIRLQLIELYKAKNQPEQALEQLQSLMTAAPRGGGPDEPHQPANPPPHAQ